MTTKHRSLHSKALTWLEWMDAKWKMALLADKQLSIKAALLNLSIWPGFCFPLRIKSEILADCRSLGIFLSSLLNSMERTRCSRQGKQI